MQKGSKKNNNHLALPKFPMVNKNVFVSSLGFSVCCFRKNYLCRNDACFIIKSNVYKSKIHFFTLNNVKSTKICFKMSLVHIQR